jgi:hypothetical protein
LKIEKEKSETLDLNKSYILKNLEEKTKVKE